MFPHVDLDLVDGRSEGRRRVPRFPLLPPLKASIRFPPSLRISPKPHPFLLTRFSPRQGRAGHRPWVRNPIRNQNQMPKAIRKVPRHL
ncbi:hypothetical protein GW17_00015431 [Ensete ventricosum]|nr:hypothetical protein GW17_00015431 [Ensete ventricosum]